MAVCFGLTRLKISYFSYGFHRPIIQDFLDLGYKKGSKSVIIKTMKTDIAGLKIDSITKGELLEQLRQKISAGQKTFVTTPYSEFLYAALKDNGLLDILNRADFAIPDGIGIFWAKRFLEIPLTATSYWGKIIQAYWQAKWTLAACIFNRKWILSALQEKISGADLVWDLAKLAEDNNLSIYLLGGFGDTPELAANRLISESANQLKVVGWSNKNPADSTIIDDIKKVAPDILLVAFGPIKQEKWIVENLPNLSVKLAIGLGGTFDYLAGKQTPPPHIIRAIGLEWLWRLFTQPHRIKRIYNATFGLANLLILEKIYSIMPLRKNAVSVVLNKQNKVLVGRRNPKPQKGDAVGEDKQKFQNYWQLPQGGIGKDIDIASGAKREILEETGLKNLELIMISSFTNSYRFPLTWERIFHKKYHYSGQFQHIVYFRFLGDNSEVKIDRSEFINHNWEEINMLEKTIASERFNLTKIVMNDLKEMREKAII